MRRGLVRSGLGVVFSFGLVGLGWEAFSRSGLFSPALTPSLVAIGSTLAQMLLSGTMLIHVLYTLYRILVGLVLAGVVGVPLGMLMGRAKPIERFLLPLVSVLSPIPSLAWVPVFILWFGLLLVENQVHRGHEELFGLDADDHGSPHERRSPGGMSHA